MIKIALIDDDQDEILLLNKLFSNYPISCQSYSSSIDFGKRANPDDFDFVFIDYLINHGAGADAILRALTHKSQTRIVLISNSNDHLIASKKFEENPVVWGLLLKYDKCGISEWIENRIYEIENPDKLLFDYKVKS